MVQRFDGGIIFEGTKETKLVQMRVVKHVLQLEQAGFRRGKVRTVKSMWAKYFGLNAKATYGQVIEEVDRRIDQLEREISGAG